MHSAARLSPGPHRACGVCGSRASKVCHHQQFIVPEGYPLPAEYDVVACGRCGFVYADPAATQTDYDRFYRDWSKYDDSAVATGGGISPHDAVRLATTGSDIARALPSRAASILDAGCATGGLLAALRAEGFTSVAGLDPSPRCAAACRKRGFQSFVGSIVAAPANLPKFDCVVLSHVLEHVYDIPAFFAAGRGLLAAGGYLYIETPDATRYEDHLYAPFQEFNTEHINHFSPQAFRNTARHFGFETILVEQKVIRTNKDIDYPAVFGFFRDCGGTDERPIVYDSELPSRISSYIRASVRQMEDIHRNLVTQLAGTPSVIVWGAGQLSMKLLTLPCLAGSRVRAFVDNSSALRGKRLAGAPIVGPEEIAAMREPIVIATLLHSDEIVAQIRRLGLRNPIIELLPASNADPPANTSTSVEPKGCLG